MMDNAVAIALAAFFTLGCIVIYRLRNHARAMTMPLTLVATSLWLTVLLLILAEEPKGGRGKAAGSHGSHAKPPVSAVANRGD